MTQYIKIFGLFCIIIFSFVSIQAQQQVELNLKQAIDNAIKTNINVIRSENIIQTQSYNIKGKYGALFPTLSFNGGWQRSNQIYNGLVTGQLGIPVMLNTDQTNYNYSLGLRADLTLFDGMTNIESVDAAKQTQTYNYLNLQKTKQDIVLQILNDYITVLKNIQIVKINTSTLEDAKVQLDYIKQYVEVGKKTVSDIYKQDALVAQDELQLEQSINDRDKSISDLVFNANLPQDKSYLISTSDFSSDLNSDYITTYVAKNSNVDLLVNTAVKNRYDYQSSIQNVTINETNLSIARNSVLFPILSGFSTYGWSGNSIQNIANSKVFTLGLSLTYPIFEGFSIDNQKQIAEINLKASNEELVQLQNQITLDIKKAVLDLKSLNKQIEITDRTIRSTEQDKILAEESYKVGLQTLLDVQTATTAYNNALINKSNLIYNFQLAQKQLEYFQGLLKY